MTSVKVRCTILQFLRGSVHLSIGILKVGQVESF